MSSFVLSACAASGEKDIKKMNKMYTEETLEITRDCVAVLYKHFPSSDDTAMSDNLWVETSLGLQSISYE